MELSVKAEKERINENVAGINGLLLAAILVMALFCHNYIRNIILGPFPMSKDELAAISSLDKQKNTLVTIEGDKILDTGRVIVTTRTRHGRLVGRESEAFYIMKVGKRWLLIRTKPGFDRLFVKGELKRITPKVYKKILEDLDDRVIYPDGMFYPVLLDTQDTQELGRIAWAVLAVLAVIAIINLSRVALWIRKQDQHPFIQQLAKLGFNQTMAGVLDAELAKAVVVGQVALTDRYIFIHRFFQTRVLRPADIVWMHIKVATHVVYGMVYDSYRLQVYTAGKEILGITDSEKGIQFLLEELHRRVPEAVVGTLPGLDDLWRQMSPQDFIHQASEAIKQKRLAAANKPALPAQKKESLRRMFPNSPCERCGKPYKDCTCR